MSKGHDFLLVSSSRLPDDREEDHAEIDLVPLGRETTAIARYLHITLCILYIYTHTQGLLMYTYYIYRII